MINFKKKAFDKQPKFLNIIIIIIVINIYTYSQFQQLIHIGH